MMGYSCRLILHTQRSACSHSCISQLVVWKALCTFNTLAYLFSPQIHHRTIPRPGMRKLRTTYKDINLALENIFRFLECVACIQHRSSLNLVESGCYVRW